MWPALPSPHSRLSGRNLTGEWGCGVGGGLGQGLGKNMLFPGQWGLQAWMPKANIERLKIEAGGPAQGKRMEASLDHQRNDPNKGGWRPPVERSCFPALLKGQTHRAEGWASRGGHSHGNTTSLRSLLPDRGRIALPAFANIPVIAGCLAVMCTVWITSTFHHHQNWDYFHFFSLRLRLLLLEFPSWLNS